MSKKSAKQATLFQSWGSKKKDPDAAAVSACHVPTKSGFSVVNNDPNSFIDLCDSFDDDEDNQILWEAEESVTSSLNISSNGSSPNRNASTSCNKNQTSETFDGNISIGVANFPSTQVNPTQFADLPGFDSSAGKLWIYPTNYSIRDYQFNIVQQVLFKNTMVTLPTGLGKTFIAAVVMYNFYRWYPQGKVVFMAPTKPLVAQQIEACYNIMGIPQDHTAEMTGSMGPSKREIAWREKRVFFLTPQVLTNDLSRGSCPAEMVKCLVIDEAHKALGNHAYCQVVRELVKYTQAFRILALSATPGSDIKAVQQVLTNLLISHIEIRTEESIDIRQYSHERKVEKFVVALGDELSKVKEKYSHIMDVVVGRLKRQGVLYNRETTSFSKFLILKAREAFRQNPPEKLQRNLYGVVEGDFALAMSLYHGYELLQLHGSRSLYNFLDSVVSGDKSCGRTRTELLRNADFNQLMEMLSGKYKFPEGLTSSQVDARPKVVGHPKMEKLQEIVLEHFKRHTIGPTRVMIFSQYRDSVQEITDMLHAHRPMVKVMSFIGQASAGKNTKGFTQKEQLKVMKQFREGGYNTLVSTCVGEEGLDIGEVDLIICFDAHKSPIRLVQRMGRTGRKREGRIVMLVTEGKEEQIYNQSQYSKRSIHKAILNGARSLHFFQHSPRMVPDTYHPTCHKMHITVKHAFKPTKKLTNESIVDKRRTICSAPTAGSLEPDQDLTLAEYQELVPWLVPEYQVPQLPGSHIAVLEKGDHSDQEMEGPQLSLSDWSPWQTTLQDTGRVGHGQSARHLVQIMEFIQLQQSLDPEDDPYGLEMAAYFNEEDVVTEKLTEQSESIIKYCTNKQENPSVKLTAGKFKNRLSEALSKLKEAEDMDTDDELPEINLKTVKTLKLSLTEHYDTELNSEYQDTGRCINKQHKTLKDKSEMPEAMDIADEKAVEVQADQKVISNGKKMITSKAKSLEEKMNKVRIRKRKKSLHTSGHISVVQLITDSDSNDFDGIEKGGVQENGEVENEKVSITSAKELKCSPKTRQNYRVHSPTKAIEDITSDYIRIRTPPPPEEVQRLCTEMDKNSGKFEVDLKALVDEWHQENKNGKYIVFPENYKGRLAYSLPTDYPESHFAMDKPLQMPVPQVDSYIDTSLDDIRVNDKCMPLKSIDTASCNLFEDDIQPSKHPENDTERHGSKSQNNKKTCMAMSQYSTSLDDKAILEIAKMCMIDEECGTASSSDINQQTTTKDFSAAIAKDDHEDEWMNTGSFAIDLDFDKFVKNAKETEVFANSIEHFNQNVKTSKAKCQTFGSEINDKNIELYDDDKCKSLFDVCQVGLELLDDEANEERNDVSQRIPFVKSKTTELSSWPFKDKMEEYKTAVIKKPIESVSQITFTQALSFVGENTPNPERMRANSITSEKEGDTNEVSKSIFNSEESADLFPDDSVIDLVNLEDIPDKEVCMTSKHFDSLSSDGSREKNTESCLNATDCSELNTCQVDSKSVFNVNIYNCVNDKYSEGKDTAWNPADNKVADVYKEDICKNTMNKRLISSLNNPDNNSRNAKLSASYEEEMDLPVFDLGFNVDDDLIPPSPDVKPSQSQKSVRLSQALNMTGKFRSQNIQSICIAKEAAEDNGSVIEGFNQARNDKCLQLNPIIGVKRNDLKNKLEESQEESFVLDCLPKHSISKKLSFVSGKFVSVPEVIEQGIKESKRIHTDLANGKNLQQTKINTKHNVSKTCKDKVYVIVEKNSFQSKNVIDEKYETSFSLLDTDLDEWIDSGNGVIVPGNTSMNAEKYSSALNTKCKDNIPANKNLSKTPIATVSPLNIPKDQNDQQLPLKCVISSSRKSNARKSVFKIADLSHDFSDDESFSYQEQDTGKDTVNVLSLPSRVQSNTSTPLGSNGCRIQSVPPFHLTSSTPIRKCESSLSETNASDQTEVQAKLSNWKLSPDFNRDGNENQDEFVELLSTECASFENAKHVKVDSSCVNQISSDLEKSVNDDSFIVVRKKKKVGVFDSPSSQHGETPKTLANVSAHSSLSENNNDDDFDDSFMMTQNEYIPVKKLQPLSRNDDFNSLDNDLKVGFDKPYVSDEDFEESFLKPKVSDSTRKGNNHILESQPANMAVKSTRSKNPFLDDEADLSEEDGELASSDEEEGSDLDQYENSFIQDSQFTASQAANQTDIHAMYLKSVRSPVGGSGKFKLKYDYNKDEDVYSQAPGPEESHYMEDSFCVGSEAEDEWMLKEDEEEVSEDEPREITLMKGDNSLMQSVRKTRRRKGVLTSFLTSRQREIQVGRMKALDKIRSRLNNKKTESEDTGKTIDKTKGKKRIHILNDSSSDEENMHSCSHANSSSNVSHVSKASQHSHLKGRKRARLLLSSDDSDSENFTNLKTAQKTARLDDSDEIRPLLTLKSVKTENFVERNNTLSKKDNNAQKEMPIHDSNKPNSVSKCLSNDSLKDKPALKPVIFVDSKEIIGSQDIISDMRFKHDIQVHAAQLQGCDYIISNRMAVERKHWSEFSNGANRAKLVERLLELGELYDRPCLIVENDRVKSREEKSTRPVNWTKYVDRTVAMLMKSNVKVLFTEDCFETGALLAELCKLEARKNMNITVSLNLKEEQLSRVKFLVSFPKLSYIHALNLAQGFRSMKEFLDSSASRIESRGKMSAARANEIYNYIQRLFDSSGLPTSYK